MQVNPEELKEKGYTELAKLNHQEIVPFVREALKKRNIYSVFFFSFNFILLLLTIWLFFGHEANPGEKGDQKFTQFSLGIFLAFLLVPLHEYLHVLAYRYVGAKNTTLRANWKKLYFMALADRFVASRKEFNFIALCPFVFISLGLFVLLFSAGKTLEPLVIGTLLAHSGMCSGDFGLLSYMHSVRKLDPVTWDDVPQGESLFLGKTTSA